MVRTLAATFLTPAHGPAVITWDTHADSNWAVSLRATIVNRDLLNHDGSGPTRTADIKIFGLEITPIALFIALVLATPLSWRRRVFQIVLGSLILQAVILAFVALSIYCESMELLLVPPFPFQSAIPVIRDALARYMGEFLPLILWVLFNFRAVGKSRSLAPSHDVPGRSSENMSRDGLCLPLR
jgi:hypothetical protein